jgi:hypothetical protein
LGGLKIYGKGVSVLAWMLALLIVLLSLKFCGTTLLKFGVHSLLQLSSEDATVCKKKKRVKMQTAVDCWIDTRISSPCGRGVVD